MRETETEKVIERKTDAEKEQRGKVIEVEKEG